MGVNRDCLVIGSGPAGLSVAAQLEKRGVSALILEREAQIAASWRARYDGFRLNTSSWFSYLPGERFPRSAGRWPSREATVSYYEGYARRRGLKAITHTDVERVERAEGRWRLITSRGAHGARFVVVATGKYRTPVIPHWPGREGFRGRLLHSADYRSPDPFRGQAALVIGPGNSGVEIALQLAHGGAHQSWLSVRTPPHIFHRDIGPLPSDVFAVLGRHLPVPLVDRAGALIRRWRIGDLEPYGLGPPPDGVYSRLRRTGMIPTVDGPFIDALRRARSRSSPPSSGSRGDACTSAIERRWNPTS